MGILWLSSRPTRLEIVTCRVGSSYHECMHVTFVLLGLSLLIQPLNAAAFQESPPEQEIPWPVKLGLRVNGVEQNTGLVDQVVLVPDVETYLDEINRWTLARRWPVLLDDGFHAVRFIHAFNPAVVLRREPVNRPLPGTAADRQRILQQVLVRTWSGDVRDSTIEDVFSSLGYVPPGIVLTSVDDPAWTAAIALAAGRGQPLRFLDGDFGKVNATIGDEKFLRLKQQVREQVTSTGYTWNALGDDLETITICRSVASKARVNLPQSARVSGVSATGKFGHKDPNSVTDLLCRNESGRRWGFAGWIHGDSVESAYVAMCSLFLQRESVWLFNGYPQEGNWNRYEMSEAAEVLSREQCHVEIFQDSRSGLKDWLRMLVGGFRADVLLANSKGNRDFFDLAGKDRGFVPDVPLLDRPLALHLIHSWSLAAPDNEATVGGRFIANGVYAYAGSVHEPFLTAFVPPELVAKRLMSLVPFLVASRHWDGPFSNAWRVTTFGDPLMLIQPPARSSRMRQPPGEGEGYSSVRDSLPDLLRLMQQAPTAESYRRAILDLRLLQQDAMAIQVWQNADKVGLAAATAGSILPAMFRVRDFQGFISAWKLMGEHTRVERDMLWHLFTPRLDSIDDPDLVAQLQIHVRPERPDEDLRRILPLLERFFGRDVARSAVQRQIERTTDEKTLQRLRKLQPR
ncbi:MAG: hypothetical protein CMJ32_02675 [Phycisphaerae bacterium]|nr:hypothetical protein [Phycisphaerae bacterium]